MTAAETDRVSVAEGGKTPRALIFGQTGQLAQCLAEAQPNSWAATFADRSKADFSAKDLSRAAAFTALIAELFPDRKPDVVINAVAYTAVDAAEDDVDTAMAVNADAVAALAVACRTADIPLIHVSTDYVFPGDLPSDRSYREDDETRPLGVYGTSKRAGEAAILAENENGLNGYIFRTAWVYSQFGGNFLKTMLRLAETRDSLNIVSDQIGSPTSAHDIAHALWSVASRVTPQDLDQPPPGIYHLTGQGHTSWHGFADEIFAQAKQLGFKTPSQVLPISSDQFPTKAARPSNSRLDGGKVSSAFGISLPQWQASILPVLTRLAKKGIA